MPSNTWDLIHAERRQLISDLEPLTAEQWRTESLCAGWDVHHVLAHLVALTKQTPPKFFGKFGASGFQFVCDWSPPIPTGRTAAGRMCVG
jgi:hypothetical protein